METILFLTSKKRADLLKVYVLFGVACFMAHESGLAWQYRGLIEPKWGFITLQILLCFSFFFATSFWREGGQNQELKLPLFLARLGLAVVLGVNLARCICFSLPAQKIQIEDRLVELKEDYFGRPPHYGSARISRSFWHIEVTNAWAHSHSVGESVVVTGYRLPGLATFITEVSSLPRKVP